MFAGHFGLAAAVRAKTPEVPLRALMLGTQLLDVVFVPLLLSGVEMIDDTSHGAGYGNLVIHADFTHSLVGALLIALVTGLLAGRRWGRRAGVILSSIVFSHWILNLVVHRADMPLLPNNWGDFPLLGLGNSSVQPTAQHREQQQENNKTHRAPSQNRPVTSVINANARRTASTTVDTIAADLPLLPSARLSAARPYIAVPNSIIAASMAIEMPALLNSFYSPAR